MIDLDRLAVLETRRQQAGLAEVAAEHRPVADGIAAFAGPGSWANLALGLGLDGPVPEPALDDLCAFYDERGVQARIEVLPQADPAFVRALGERGFRLERFENLWLRPLPAGEDLRAALPFGWPPGVEVRPVGEGDEEVFVEVSSSGFRAPGQPLSDADRGVALRMLAHPRVISLLAWVDGAPAGAASAEARGPASGLFGATVLPAWRGRGVQQALMAARLEAVRARGAKVACIESPPGGPTERNARRLGFQLAGTKVLLRRPAPMG